MYHRSVLLDESIAGLRMIPNGTYADLTYGGGGHTAAILSHLEGGRVIAFDQDPQALANRIDDPRLTMVDGNFRHLLQYLRFYDALPLDGIIADLGISSHQIDQPDRGFSTRWDAPLDMRMDNTGGPDAATLLQTIPEDELARILFAYGELPQSKRIARAIIRYRDEKPITGTTVLKEAVSSLVPPRQEHKFLAQLFQAIRIAVNDELAALKEMLEQCPAALKPGGRLVVIAYHSLEDRLVKHFMRSGNFDDAPEKDFYGNASSQLKVITRRAITPSDAEIALNNRARSAKLRIAERN